MLSRPEVSVNVFLPKRLVHLFDTFGRGLDAEHNPFPAQVEQPDGNHGDEGADGKAVLRNEDGQCADDKQNHAGFQVGCSPLAFSTDGQRITQRAVARILYDEGEGSQGNGNDGSYPGDEAEQDTDYTEGYGNGQLGHAGQSCAIERNLDFFNPTR